MAEQKKCTALHKAIIKGNLQSLTRIIDCESRSLHSDQQIYEKRSNQKQFIILGDIDRVRSLIGQVGLNNLDFDGNTPLHLATIKRNRN